MIHKKKENDLGVGMCSRNELKIPRNIFQFLWEKEQKTNQESVGKVSEQEEIKRKSPVRKTNKQKTTLNNLCTLDFFKG